MWTADQFKTVFEAKQVAQVTPEVQFQRVRLSPDATYLIGAGYDARIHRWQLGGEAPVALPEIAGHNGWVQSLRCLSTRPWIVSVDTWGQLRCTGLAGDAPEVVWSIPEAHDGWIVDLALSPDESTLATCGHDGVVRVWRTENGEKLQELTGHAAEVFCVTFSPDGLSLFSGDLQGHVKQWNTADGQLIREFDATSMHLSSRLQEIGGPRFLIVSSDGTKLLVGGTTPKNGGNVQGKPTVLTFDIADGKLLETHTLGADGDVYVTEIVELSPGEWLASISGNPGTGKLVAFHQGVENPVYETKKYANCHSLDWNREHRRIAVCTTNTGSNGNGRPLKDGEYQGNYSPVFLFTLPEPAAAGE